MFDKQMFDTLMFDTSYVRQVKCSTLSNVRQSNVRHVLCSKILMFDKKVRLFNRNFIIIFIIFIIFLLLFLLLIKILIFTIFSTFFGEIEPKNDKINSFDQKCTVFVYFYGAFDTFRAQFH